MRHVVVLCLGFATIMAALMVAAPRASAASALTLGSVSDGVFEADDFVTGCVTLETVTATLTLNGVTVDSVQSTCTTGTVFQSTLALAEGASGNFEVVVTGSSSGLIVSRTWVLPSLALQVSAKPSTANVGDSVWVEADISLKSNGVDLYIRTRGTFTVGDRSETIQLIVSGPGYDTWIGLTRPKTYYAGMPLAFGTAGTKTVQVRYFDEVEDHSGSVSIVVVSPVDAQLAALQARVSSLETNGATKSDIAAVQADLAALSKNVSANDTAAQSAIADLRSRLDTLKTGAERTESDVTTTRSDLSTTQLVSYAAVALGLVGIIVGIIAVIAGRRRSPPAPPPSGPQ